MTTRDFRTDPTSNGEELGGQEQAAQNEDILTGEDVVLEQGTFIDDGTFAQAVADRIAEPINVPLEDATPGATTPEVVANGGHTNETPEPITPSGTEDGNALPYTPTPLASQPTFTASPYEPQPEQNLTSHAEVSPISNKESALVEAVETEIIEAEIVESSGREAIVDEILVEATDIETDADRFSTIPTDPTDQRTSVDPSRSDIDTAMRDVLQNRGFDNQIGNSLPTDGYTTDINAADIRVGEVAAAVENGGPQVPAFGHANVETAANGYNSATPADIESTAIVSDLEAGLGETSAAPTGNDTGVFRRSLVTPGVPAEPEPTPAAGAFAATAVTSATSGPGATATQVAPPTPTQATGKTDENTSPSKFDSSIMSGATILPEVPSRSGKRWLSAIGIFLLTPLAWYLLADAGARLTVADGNPWLSGTVNVAALGELFGGLVVLALIGWLASLSSLGLTISGVILLVLGLPFLVAPAWTLSFISGPNITDPLMNLGDFGSNVAFHLLFTGFSGILVMAGFAMLCGAWVTYRVRRKGREEEALRVEVTEVNPDGLKARWARKSK